MSAFAGLTVAVADSPNPLKKRRAGRDHFLAKRLRAFGCEAIYLHDGDRAGLNVDLLILYGNARSFYKYASLLRAKRNRRPVVAVWQIDPLPPLEFDRRLEADAHRLSSLLGRSRLLRPVEMAASLPLFHAIAKHGLGPYSDPASGHVVDGAMARTAVESYGYIRRGIGEGWLDHVFVSTTGKQRFLASRGINSVFTPVGFHDSVGEDRDLPRDIDVLFIGKLGKRHRRRRLDTARQAIEKTGARFVTVEQGCFGEMRTALLNRTKIVMNILKYPWDTPWMRWAMSAECGALVVSETLNSPEPLVPGVHYVDAPFDDLPRTIERLLADPQEILAMARRCAHLFRTQMSLHGSLETILTTTLGRSSKT